MRRFCVWTTVGIGIIVMMSITFPRTNPWRWSYWDFGYIAPVVVCAIAAVMPRKFGGAWSRAISGFCQSLAFLAVFAQGRVSLRDPVEVTVKWVTWGVAYTIVFTAITQGVFLMSKHSKKNHET